MRRGPLTLRWHRAPIWLCAVLREATRAVRMRVSPPPSDVGLLSGSPIDDGWSRLLRELPPGAMVTDLGGRDG